MSYIDTGFVAGSGDHAEAPLAALAAAVDLLNDHAPAAADGEALQLALVELAASLLDSMRDAPAATLAAFHAAPPRAEHASRAADLVTESFFPDGRQDIAALEEAAALSLATLLALGDRRDEAMAVLDRADAMFQAGGWHEIALIARGLTLGAGDLSTLWTDPERFQDPLASARARVEARELDLDAHRAVARRSAEMEGLVAGFHALLTAMALPVGAEDRAGLADDLAVVLTLLHARGDAGPLAEPRVGLALKANPAIALRALAQLATDRVYLRLAGPAAVASTSRLLQRFANPVDPQVRSPYPIRNGRPHVETVWLEITNFCNQKCTFCPDMHREDARTWLPLAEVKRLIDELADTVSVGSMQLNAYGEPLLHPNIREILAYINEKRLPWPTFFTTHGLTLVPKKLAQLSRNYPAGIALSLHNDSQDSYAATRSAKLGDYDTLVSRTSDLLRQMVNEAAACHMRLYQMVSNGQEDWRVDPKVRAAFPGTPERMAAHVRKWESIAAEIAAAAPPEVDAVPLRNTDEHIARMFAAASHHDGTHLPILDWRDLNGNRQQAFMSPRPVGSYANLLLEYHPDWRMERRVVNALQCGFVAAPSLAIFATRTLGICCLDLNSTGTFGSLDDFPSLADALMSPAAARMFAQVANGVATSRGCQICLGEGRQLCRT